MVRKSAKQDPKTIPLSKNTICRRIDITVDNINDHLVAKISGDEFSLQVNEATASTTNKDAHWICCV